MCKTWFKGLHAIVKKNGSKQDNILHIVKQLLVTAKTFSHLFAANTFNEPQSDKFHYKKKEMVNSIQ